MQVEHKVNDRVTVIATGESPLELFQNLSSLGEIFGEEKCGKCDGTNISFRIRKAMDGKKELLYPEMVCNEPKCRAKLAFGQMEGGGLFPVRFERKDGEYVKDDKDKKVPKGSNGWVRWNFDKKCEE